jgi:hypothetical protein
VFVGPGMMRKIMTEAANNAGFSMCVSGAYCVIKILDCAARQ